MHRLPVAMILAANNFSPQAGVCGYVFPYMARLIIWYTQVPVGTHGYRGMPMITHGKQWVPRPVDTGHRKHEHVFMHTSCVHWETSQREWEPTIMTPFAYHCCPMTIGRSHSGHVTIAIVNTCSCWLGPLPVVFACLLAFLLAFQLPCLLACLPAFMPACRMQG
jgi:hypothetical protein